MSATTDRPDAARLLRGPETLHKNLTPEQSAVVVEARSQGMEVVDLGLKLALASFAWKAGEKTKAAADRLLMDVVEQLKKET